MKRPALLISLLALSACGDLVDPVGPNADRGAGEPAGPAEPPTYSLVLSISTSGYTRGGNFGFTVNGQSGTIGPNDTVSVRNLRAGTYDVVLHVRPDCRATNAVQAVSLLGRDTPVHFEVACFGWGTVRVSTASLGAAPWGSHALEIEVGDIGVPLRANETTVVRLVAGQHWLTFVPAPNCTTQTPMGGLTDLQADETVELRVQATCEPAGTLRVSFTSSGANLPNGIYWDWDAAHVGTGAVKRVRLLTGSKTNFMLTTGDWTGQFVQLPENCQAATANPTPFSIEEGQVSEITVSIQCTRYMGWLRVTLTTTGPAATLGLNINGTCSTSWDWMDDWCRSLKPNGSEIFELSPGSYDVHVTPFKGVVRTDACTVSPKDPVLAEVRVGVITDVAFTIVCV